MINEANPAHHAWLTLQVELARRDIRGWVLALPPDARSVAVACSLLGAFVQAHGRLDGSVNLLVAGPFADIAELWPGRATRTLVHPGVAGGLLDDLSLFSRFAPGGVFVADPFRCGDGRLDAFLGHAGVDIVDLWRYALHLPWSAEPEPPRPSPAHVERAEARLAALGTPAGRTAVLCPELDRPVAHWAALAERLRRDGWAVAVRAPDGASDDWSAEAASALGGAPVIPIPLAELIPFCARAGRAVAEGGPGYLARHIPAPVTIVHPDLRSLAGHVASPPWAGAGPCEVAAPPTDGAEAFAEQAMRAGLTQPGGGALGG